MTDFPDSPPVGGAIRVCGERGFVAFCRHCQDWESISITPTYVKEPGFANPIATGGRNASCGTCDTEFPRGPSYKKAEKQ